MARTAITPQNVPGSYPGTIAANGADFTWAAADVTNKNQFISTGRELLLVKNDDVAAQTITINSAQDPYKRTGDISSYSLGIAEFAVFGPFPVLGWIQSDSNIYLEASSANIKFAVLKLP